MKRRKLTSGDLVQEFDKAVTLKVYTRCPEKYKLIDMETGEEYIGNVTEGNNSWRKLTQS